MKGRKTGLSVIVVLLAMANIAGIFKLQIQAEVLSQAYTFLAPDEIM